MERIWGKQAKGEMLMKQLTCELCGSTDIIKQDGAFVCQSCGCKYSLEEARKLMSDGAIAVAGAVRQDNGTAISNFMDMARNAIDAGNNREAENYCNRVIELDITNWEAWFIKGRAVGWQSTLANIRISESINAFSKALENCPENMRDKQGERCKTELKNMQAAILSARVKNFKTHPSDDDLAGLRSDCRTIMVACAGFLSKAKIGTDSSDNVQYARIINEGISDAWQALLNDFVGDDTHPSDHEFTRFISESDTLIEALKLALVLCGDAFDNKELNDVIAQIYKNMIIIQETLINASSYSVGIDGDLKLYNLSCSLTAHAKVQRKKEITEWRRKLQDVYQGTATFFIEAAKKRREEYWAAHSEEKKQLEAERTRLLNERSQLADHVSALKEEKRSLPVRRELDEREEEIRRLTAQKSELSIFKGKEKKALQERIEALERVTSTLREQLKQDGKRVDDEISSIQLKIKKIDERCSQIANEFKRDR